MNHEVANHSVEYSSCNEEKRPGSVLGQRGSCCIVTQHELEDASRADGRAARAEPSSAVELT